MLKIASNSLLRTVLPPSRLLVRPSMARFSDPKFNGPF